MVEASASSNMSSRNTPCVEEPADAIDDMKVEVLRVESP